MQASLQACKLTSKLACKLASKLASKLAGRSLVVPWSFPKDFAVVPRGPLFAQGRIIGENPWRGAKNWAKSKPARELASKLASKL